MGILPYRHPDVIEFINVKTSEGKLENFDISIAVRQQVYGSSKKLQKKKLKRSQRATLAKG